MALTNVPPAYAAIGLVLLFLITTLTSSRGPQITRNGKALPKPPNTLPLVGNGILFLRPRQVLFSWFTKCIHQHGHTTLQISVPSLPPGVIISSPACLDYVFKHEGLFEKGSFFKDRSWDLFGNGIINTDGEAWRVQRKAGLGFLSKNNLRILTDVALPRFLEEACETLDVEKEVDLQEVIHEVTTQIMGRMAYGREMHAGDDFTQAFEYASGKTAERFQNPLWWCTEMVTGQKLRRSIRLIKQYGEDLVRSAMTARDKGVAADQDGVDGIAGSLINSLLDAIQDEKLVADSALNYLSAGRDTVAQALTWTFYLLMRHPSVTEKLRESLEEDTAESPYIIAVFYEVLRLYPPIPFEIKQAQQETTLPDGTYLPATSVVVWCPWAMNRSEITWGPDAPAFRPERWLNEHGHLINRNAAEFPVFNGGARLCLGKKMAEVIAVQVITCLVPRYDFTPAYTGERVSRSSLTLPMEGGLPVFPKRRRSKEEEGVKGVY
ncbi:cytochrome P450 [Emericellopsis atlantica]|uniref:Cytochrome P450 n=1 Tax=Emericellopsis atlantica TaxID=2614577 RepID=A0A9P7ZG92_9HYPO|nr:cytochrome P450 [Emericellopsis atlantica]KAG9251257.1 cytochrome P450 [Emericellopsis atlantica]